MSWNDVVGGVKEQLPHFNDYLLKGFRKEQVARFPEFMDTAFNEAIQLFNGELKYLGYHILSPEKRLEYTTNNNLVKSRINVQRSELQLVEFTFQYQGVIYPVQLYIPYLYRDALVINDTRYYMELAINERMIYRVPDGVIIKVMRSPLQFWRTEQARVTTESGYSLFEPVITVKAHYSKTSSKNRKKTPLVLYLMSRYGFDQLCGFLGISAGDLAFVEKPVKNDLVFDYIRCKDHLYIKVNKELLQTVDNRRFIISIWYILSKVRRNCSISDVYNTTLYKTQLGKALYGANVSEALAAGHAESHLDSLKSYLDQYSKNELALMNIHCNDVFDLFWAVFMHIDTWLFNYRPNDLFSKRISGAELIMMAVVEQVFTRFYDTLGRNKVIGAKEIKSMLKIDAMKITKIHDVTSLQSTTSLYNDNTLTSVLIKKVRQSSSRDNKRNAKGGKKQTNLITAKEHQFDPSFLAIESALAISSSSPGTSGDVNPYAVIDKRGYFCKDKMPWYQEIAGLRKYLN